VRECLHAGNWRAARALVAQFQEEGGGAAAALSPSAYDELLRALLREGELPLSRTRTRTLNPNPSAYP
jgi:hypothetical protein